MMCNLDKAMNFYDQKKKRKEKEEQKRKGKKLVTLVSSVL